MGLFQKLQGLNSKTDETQQGRDGAASSSLAPPPAYTSDDARSSVSDDAAPEYMRPRFHQEGSAMALMPAIFNVYASWKSTSKLHIGLASTDKKYLVTCHWGWFTSKPPITIYNGLSPEDQVLVQVGPMKRKASQESVITVPSRPGRTGSGIHVPVGFKSESWREWNYTFTMPIIPQQRGEEPMQQEHTFQWRNTTGEEVRILDNGSRWSSGWKLIWLTGPESGHGVGFGGDGREVVAVAAQSAKSMTKIIRFVFMGTGLTGTLGGDWEAIAAASAIQLWWNTQQQAAVATGTASVVTT